MTYLILISSIVIGFFLEIALRISNRNKQFFLSFSGAYLLSITFLHLVPEVFNNTSFSPGIFIIIGVFSQVILDYFSRGVEHGHIHTQSQKSIPVSLFIGLYFHAFMEGLPLQEELSSHSNMLLGLAIHKIPVALILSSFLLKSSLSKLKIGFYLLIFTLMTPLGSYLGSRIPFLISYEKEILAIVVGIFFHVSTTILFEASKEHTFNFKKLLFILIGIVLALIT